jgi:hypothetical protein
MSLLLGERLVGVEYLMGEADILSGKKAFGADMADGPSVFGMAPLVSSFLY